MHATPHLNQVLDEGNIPLTTLLVLFLGYLPLSSDSKEYICVQKPRLGERSRSGRRSPPGRQRKLALSRDNQLLRLITGRYIPELNLKVETDA
jgi:hypothetical protein